MQCYWSPKSKIANEYVYEHGLRFNPAKPTCMIMGCNPFTTEPVWTIDNVPLNVSVNINYLGPDFWYLTEKTHYDSRIDRSRTVSAEVSDFTSVVLCSTVVIATINSR